MSMSSAAGKIWYSRPRGNRQSHVSKCRLGYARPLYGETGTKSLFR